MRYIYTGGPYRQFRGYVFIGQTPVEITDRGTLLAIERMHDFKLKQEEHHEDYKEEKTEAKTEVLTPAKATVANACPKCGRVLSRGMFMHRKYCRGV